MERIEKLDRMIAMGQRVDDICLDTMYAYKRAIDNDLEMPDLNEWLPREQMMLIVLKNFRDLGIRRFTISSGTSNMNEYAWFLIENGCKLEGMTLIKVKPQTSWERADKPVFVFSIEEN